MILATLVVLLVVQPDFRCSGNDNPVNRDLRTAKVQVGSLAFTLEIADNDRTREIGLMNRASMPADHGMLFVFPTESWRGFWMKNTRIPLDIIYLDARGRVVSIHSMKPFDLDTTSSDGPARFAIELNAGMAAKTGLKVGDRVVLPE